MNKKTISILLAAVTLVLCLSGCKETGPKVAVMPVSEIVGIGPIGISNRFSGVVEAGETVSVDKDNEMEIKEIAVSAGEAVSKGQVLFTYQTDTLSIEIEKMQLEVEQMNNGITIKKSQITALEKEQKAAASADKLQYTLQIQQLQLDVKESEYNVTAKKKEIDRAKTRLADANVLSPVTGYVKAVNASGSDFDPVTGQPLPFISIEEEGDFRVKGTLNEMNAGSFAEGTPVILRSRTNEAQFWTGTVSLVDYENPVSNNNNMYMATDEMTTTSRYNFYVRLNGDEGLMLGQHVYIEQDNGQMQEDATDTFYLPSFYISDLDAEPYVWAASEKDKLEKRPVVLGNFNIDMDSYEIMEGLTIEDFIAYPDDTCTEGARVRYPGEEEEITDGEEPVPDTPDGVMPDGGDIIGGDVKPGGDIIGGEVEPGGEGFIDEGISVEPVETTALPDPKAAALENSEAVG